MQKRRDKSDKKVKTWKEWLLFVKNAVLIRYRLRDIVGMLGSRGVQSLHSFSDTKRAFVDNSRMIEINAVTKGIYISCFKSVIE